MKLDRYLELTKQTRADFAQLVGVTEVSLSRYITGNRIPRPSLLKKIAQASAGAVMPNDFVDIDFELINKKETAA
jgi:transcriptional regulator with XRE-family HTH domain